jgi:hypothetical protein
MNVEKLIDVCKCEFDDDAKYKSTVMSIAGIEPKERIKSDALVMKSFY